VLPKDSNGVHVVIDNECTRSFTYQINGPVVKYLGPGDRHDKGYDGHVVRRRLDNLGEFATRDSVYSGARMHRDYCPFTFNVYPSDEMNEALTTNNPFIFASIAVVIFLLTSLVFFLYDRKVERRQETVLSSAKRTTKIVSSLFPSTVRDKLYPVPERPVRRNSLDAFMPGKLQSSHRNLTSSTECSTSSIVCSPIADLYPDTTVLFADIAGFTVWSSARTPTQVFHLLETVYSAFDSIARHRGVFKVETIGDSYVAVVGLPTPRRHHAVVMAMFANDCRAKFRQVTMELEKTLGPVSCTMSFNACCVGLHLTLMNACLIQGTADLAMRFGLNSGSTTGGVLRGEKARFQLFGDVRDQHSRSRALYRLRKPSHLFCLFHRQTVNTAARMESNGKRNKIQVSQKTAYLIKLSGKGFVSCHVPIHRGLRIAHCFRSLLHFFSAWLVPREEKVNCKGKGMMTTFWCDPCCTSESFINSDDSPSIGQASYFTDGEARLERLIDWNVDLFTHLVLDVVKCRGSMSCDQGCCPKPSDVPREIGRPQDEVAEVIDFRAVA
jgi:class 3 adenylate cyclase